MLLAAEFSALQRMAICQQDESSGGRGALVSKGKTSHGRVGL